MRSSNSITPCVLENQDSGIEERRYRCFMEDARLKRYSYEFELEISVMNS